MLETIMTIRSNFVALLDKVDKNSKDILKDKAYMKEMAESIAKVYIYLNDAICAELSMCHTCAQQSDYLREAMSMFESLSLANEVDEKALQKYEEFPHRLEEIIQKINLVLEETS